LHPLKHTSNLLKWLYHTKSQLSGWNISCLTCKLSFTKCGTMPRPSQSNGWNIGWLLNIMHTIHLQNVVKCQVPIGWIKHQLLNMQTSHLQKCVATMTFQYPILATASCALVIAFGSDKHNRSYRTHWVIAIAMIIVIETLFVTPNQF
jgi:hypothetical protein